MSSGYLNHTERTNEAEPVGETESDQIRNRWISRLELFGIQTNFKFACARIFLAYAPSQETLLVIDILSPRLAPRRGDHD